MSTDEPRDIHALIQDKWSITDLLRQVQNVDEHALGCESCRERLIGFTCHFPKLFANATVAVQERVQRIDQLTRLKRGQCLPCGCEVTHTPWTQEQASRKFYDALATALKISPDQAIRLPAGTRLSELPLDTCSLRRLRDAFWYPDGSSLSAEQRDIDEGDTVLQLPETIGQFIAEIAQVNAGISYTECSHHWCP